MWSSFVVNWLFPGSSVVVHHAGKPRIKPEILLLPSGKLVPHLLENVFKLFSVEVTIHLLIFKIRWSKYVNI